MPKKDMEDRLGRRYAALGLSPWLIHVQVRRELCGMILRAWEVGAPLRVIGERLGISAQRAQQLKDKALRWRSLPTPLEVELTEPDEMPRTCVEVPMFRLGETSPDFCIKFGRLAARDFMSVPGGSEPIRSALRTRGLDPDDYWTSPFFIRETIA